MTHRLGREVCICGLLLAALCHPVAALTKISLGPSAGQQDDVVEVPILFNSDNRIAGLQIDLTYDPAVASIGDPSTATIESRIRTDGSEVEAGKYRILILGESGDLLPEGRLITIPVTLKQSVASSQAAVGMTGIMIADEYGLSRNYSMQPYLELLEPNGGMPVDPQVPVTLDTLADFGAGIEEVQLYANGRLLGSIAPGDPAPTWVPEEPGSTRLKIVGVDANGTSFEAPPIDVTITGDPITNYADWKDYYFKPEQVSDDAITAPDKDPDGDLRTNLQEYIEGTKPAVEDAPPVDPSSFFMENGGAQFFAVRMRRRIGVSDAEVTARESQDLKVWTDAGVSNLEEAGNFEIVTFHTLTPTSDDSRGFLTIEGIQMTP